MEKWREEMCKRCNEERCGYTARVGGREGEGSREGTSGEGRRGEERAAEEAAGEGRRGGGGRAEEARDGGRGGPRTEGLGLPSRLPVPARGG